jgi:hypothetical protein
MRPRPIQKAAKATVFSRQKVEPHDQSSNVTMANQSKNCRDTDGISFAFLKNQKTNVAQITELGDR